MAYPDLNLIHKLTQKFLCTGFVSLTHDEAIDLINHLRERVADLERMGPTPSLEREQVSAIIKSALLRIMHNEADEKDVVINALSLVIKMAQKELSLFDH